MSAPSGPRPVTKAEARVVRAAAIGLALWGAWLLAQLAYRDRPPAEASAVVLTFLRGMAVTGALQIGLFWAPGASRGWQRVLAAALMVPSVLLFGGLAGEAVVKVVRGFPLRLEAAAFSVAGLAVYGWQLWSLARRSWPLHRHGGMRSAS
jgi:hypothetical protein